MNGHVHWPSNRKCFRQLAVPGLWSPRSLPYTGVGKWDLGDAWSFGMPYATSHIAISPPGASGMDREDKVLITVLATIKKSRRLLSRSATVLPPRHELQYISGADRGYLQSRYRALRTTDRDRARGESSIFPADASARGRQGEQGLFVGLRTRSPFVMRNASPSGSLVRPYTHALASRLVTLHWVGNLALSSDKLLIGASQASVAFLIGPGLDKAEA